jgi:hypothetical protein
MLPLASKPTWVPTTVLASASRSSSRSSATQSPMSSQSQATGTTKARSVRSMTAKSMLILGRVGKTASMRRRRRRRAAGA